MTVRDHLVDAIAATIGGVAGGVVGYRIFFWLTGQGFYGMMIPGALLGLGSGLLARHPSQVRGLVCGLAGLALGVYTEWKFAPFLKDDSLTFLLTHLQDKTPIKLLMIGLGAVFAYWLGKDGGLDRIAPRRSAPPPGG